MAPPIYALVSLLPERKLGASGFGPCPHRKNKLLQPCNKAAGAFPLLYNSCLSVLDAWGHRSRFRDPAGLHGRKFRLDPPYSSILLYHG